MLQRESCMGELAAGCRESRERGYMGVRWSRKKNKWRVRIKANGKDKHVGFYSEAVTAAIAYDEALKKYNPNWAVDPTIKLNFPGAGARSSALCAVDRNAAGLARFYPFTSFDPRGPGGLGHADMLSSMQAHALSSARLCGDTAPATLRPGANARVAPFDETGSAWSPLGGVMLMPGAPDVASPRQLAPLVSAPWKLDMDSRSKTAVHDALEHQGVKAGHLHHKKASLSHLLDDKSSLARTPSPADGSLTVAGTRGSLSSMSTPATLPSPSVILSPVQNSSGGGHQRRGQGHGSQAATPLGTPGPPLLTSNAQQQAGVIAPAGIPACLPGGQVSCRLGGPVRAQSAAVADGVDHCREAQALQTLERMRNDKGLGSGKDPRRQGGDHGPCITAADAAAWRSLPSALPTCGLTAGTTHPPAGLNGVKKRQDGSAVDEGRGGHARRNQSYRGVTWDRVKQMWRVRLCLAGGGREHVGYFADEEEGALAYQQALLRTQRESPGGRGPAIQVLSPDGVQQQGMQHPVESAAMSALARRRPLAVGRAGAEALDAPRSALAAWAPVPLGGHVGVGQDMELAMMQGYGNGAGMRDIGPGSVGEATLGGTARHVSASCAAPASMTALFNEHVNPAFFGAEELPWRMVAQGERHPTQDCSEYCLGRAGGHLGLAAFASHSASPCMPPPSRQHLTTPLLGYVATSSPSLYHRG